jgi:hypothetical protein
MGHEGPLEAVGICGSDLRTIRNGSLPPGTVLGHEFVLSRPEAPAKLLLIPQQFRTPPR